MSSFKRLFIKEDEDMANKPKNTPIQTPSTTNQGIKFPDNTEKVNQGFNLNNESFAPPTFVASPISYTNGVPQELIDNALKIYQEGFDALNQDGFDFYEFYQMVINGGISNPQVYNMVFSMIMGVDKTMSKDKLLQQSDYYITAIMAQYNDFVAQGNSKKQSIEFEKNQENQALISEVETIKQQMESLRIQLDDRQRKLNEIVGKYDPKINEIENKLNANVIAKDKIINTIEQVKQGIINNLK